MADYLAWAQSAGAKALGTALETVTEAMSAFAAGEHAPAVEMKDISNSRHIGEYDTFTRGAKAGQVKTNKNGDAKWKRIKGLELYRLGAFHFETMYGWQTIAKFVTRDGDGRLDPQVPRRRQVQRRQARHLGHARQAQQLSNALPSAKKAKTMYAHTPVNLTDTLVSIDHAEAQGDRSHLSDEQIATLDRGTQRLMAGDATAVHAVESVLSWTVRMPVYRWDAAQHEVGKLARKAAKKCVNPPKIEEVEREVIGEGDEAETWIRARLLGAAPVLNGWSCVATLTPGITCPDCEGVGVLADPDDERAVSDCFRCAATGVTRPVIHTATGESLSADAHDQVSMRCDHVVACTRNGRDFTRSCGKRKRNLVFVIEHADHGIKCVGSKCLNEYLGSDALTAWFVFSRFHALGAHVNGGSWDRHLHAQWLADNPEAACTSSGRADVPVPVRDFVACCVAHVAVRGYLRSTDARSVGVAATGRAVWGAYQDATHVAPTADDFARADEIDAWIQTLDKSETDRYGEPSYLAQLAHFVSFAGEGTVSRVAANWVASAVPTFERELVRRAEQANTINEYLPGVASGDKIMIELTVQRTLGWSLSCLDGDGRTVLVGSVTHFANDDNTPIVAGDVIRVIGKVRDFNDYRGTRQTRMNYAKAYPFTGLVKL